MGSPGENKVNHNSDVKVNGQAYSLEAGKTQELKLTGEMVIEFDRALEDKSSR